MLFRALQSFGWVDKVLESWWDIQGDNIIQSMAKR